MKNTLTAYFSASGVTKQVAETIAQMSGSDLYEIQPSVPYTIDDLDWRNPQSRSSVEMKNRLHPQVGGEAVDLSAYDTILIGFPIWWGVAPTVVNSFLEAHSFKGKKIVLFATSGGSGWGQTAEELMPSAPGAIFSGRKLLNPTEDEIRLLVSRL